MDTFGSKLQQKALQQPKQKKSKSAEFLMGKEERAAVVGLENPAFDGEGSAKLSIPPVWLGREIRGDERAQNYFDPSPVQQTDPRHCRMAGRRLLLHGGGHASGSRPSQAHTIAKTQDEASAGLGGEAGLEAGRMVMGRESTVKMRMAEEVIPHYAQQLRERVQPDMITLGSLSLQQRAAPKGPVKRTQWEKRKKRILAFFTGIDKQQNHRKPVTQRAGEGQEEATAKFDQMTKLPESSYSTSQPMWQIDKSCWVWVCIPTTLKCFRKEDVNQSTTPQPVEVCVCCLRATRDKLPRGHYAVSVALNSRLGGSAWCSKQWTASTEPVEHRGHFYDTDLHFNQNLFMILPAACELVPSMVLIFQLIALQGDGNHISSVVAWGAFPVCGSNLSLVQGRGSHLERLGGQSVASLYPYPLLTP
ncbi:hypothetical protein INR49_021191 [Caranx melampygus]|nr:hypothetical protein INR49_021191 [Caranx melampygus]